MAKVKVEFKNSDIQLGINLIGSLYKTDKNFSSSVNDDFTRTMVSLKKAWKSVNDSIQAMVELHVKHDDSGNPKTVKTDDEGMRKYEFKNSGSESAYKKAYKDLLAEKQELTILVPKYSDIKDLGLNPDLVSELIILGLIHEE